VRRYLNILITMTLGGLWHGAGWTFVLWGLYHGLLLLVNHAWRSWGGNRRLAAPLCLLLTFLAVVFGWVLFRSDSLTTARLMVNTVQIMRRAGAFLLSDDTTRRHLAEDNERPSRPRLAWAPSIGWAALAALCLALGLMPLRPRLEFLYFQF